MRADIIENDVSFAEVTSKKAYTCPYPSFVVKCSEEIELRG